MPLSRNERLQFERIQQTLALDREFAARMAVGRPRQRRFLAVLFFAGIVLLLAGIVGAQLTLGAIVLCFYGLLALSGAVMGHWRMVARGS